MKFLFDLFPVIVFFVAFKIYGIYIATAVAIGATLVQIAWSWLRHRKVDNMLWVSFGLIAVLGGATLFLRDETFIKWKPTVLYWVFGVSLLVAEWGFGKNLIRLMMQKQLALPEPVWRKLLLSWVAFFAAMGVINLWIAYHFSTDAWVNFKLFGGMGLMLGFIVLQALMLAKYTDPQSK
jgi:intracellular septation protein